MKHTSQHMIKVIMDGINDTGMMADYAEDAREEGHDKAAIWFTARAKERLAQLRRDWNDVDTELGLHKHGDELVRAMTCHIDKEIARLREEIEGA